MLGLAFRQRLAGRGHLVAVHFAAPLRWPARAAGRPGRFRAGTGPLGLPWQSRLALFARLQRGDAWFDAPLFAALWLAAELARGTLLTGFPWAATGYGQIDGPLAALAPWVGVYGIGFVTAAIAALPALALRAGAWRAVVPALTAAALLAAATMAARDFTVGTGQLGVTLVQTNVAQDEKFAPERLAAGAGLARGRAR